MRALRTAGVWVVAAAAGLCRAGGADYREGEVNVKFAPGAALAPLVIPGQLGGTVKGADPTIGWYTLRLPARLSTASAVTRLRAMPQVLFAEPNYFRRPLFNPNDPQFPSQYGPQKIGAPGAWNGGLGYPTVTIAFIDTGIDTAHPEFKGRLQILNGCNFADRNSDPSDADGHGTHVAGIAAAGTNNGIGIAGICGASIMPVRVFDGGNGGTIDIVSRAYEFAANNGADVINASLGGATYSQEEFDAVTYAISRGSIFVAAAGNSGGTGFVYPAAYPGVVSVAASDANDKQPPYTQFGSWVSVAAPGDKIVSTWIGESYAYESGTSMAAPHVAGAMALLKSLAPTGVDPSAIRDALLSTTDSVGPWVHYGRINVNSAWNLLVSEITGSATIFPTDATRFEGSVSGGNLGSFRLVDGNTYNVQSISPTPGIQAASVELEFLLATTPSKIGGAKFNFSAFGTNNGTSFLYLYNWLKSRYEYVTGVAMTATGNSIHFVNLPANMSRYVHAGKVLAVLRGYLSAQSNGGIANPFTYQVDLASMTLSLPHGP